MSRYGDALGIDSMPSLCQFPLYYHGGMSRALMVLMWSTEKGMKKATVHGTSHKTRGTLTVLWQASLSAGSDIVLSSCS